MLCFLGVRCMFVFATRSRLFCDIVRVWEKGAGLACVCVCVWGFVCLGVCACLGGVYVDVCFLRRRLCQLPRPLALRPLWTWGIPRATLLQSRETSRNELAVSRPPGLLRSIWSSLLSIPHTQVPASLTDHFVYTLDHLKPVRSATNNAEKKQSASNPIFNRRTSRQNPHERRKTR